MVPNHHDHLPNQRGVVISSSSFTNSSNIMTITVMVVLVPVHVVLIIVVVIRLSDVSSPSTWTMQLRR